MPRRNILVGDDNKLTETFLSEYFSETKSIPIFAKSPEDMLGGFGMMKPDFVFVNVDWLDSTMVKHLEQHRKGKPSAKFFSLGYAKDDGFKWDNQFEIPLEQKAFRKKLLGEVTFPEKVKLLIVDDEEGILELFKDFFELQKDPYFEVQTARDGLDGFRKIESMKPDCLVLDIKMPIRTGIEVYADMKKSGREIPTIAFIDSTSPDEIAQMRKSGNPVFVEKSGHRSSMQEMLALAKKLVAFW